MTRFSIAYTPSDTEFSVSDGDFSALETRDSGNGSDFHYFFDTQTNRLITDFVLEDRPQVATLCQVTLIKKDDNYSPRIRLWKKDKTKLGKKVVETEVTETEVTKIIKATVDTSDAYQNFWKLIHFLQSFSELSLPDNNFRVVTDDRAELAKSFEGKDKQTILEAVRIALGGSITEEDLHMMSNRKAQLEVFEKLLDDADYFQHEQEMLDKKPEAIWQRFFEANPWIFGYGLNLIACEPLDERKMERITTGANIFTGAGKRSDAVMRSKGYISSLAFCEIKTHRTPLLDKAAYRPPDVYQASKELSGGLSQVQKTVSKALQLISSQLHELYEDDGTPTGIQVSTTKPRQVLVIGHLQELAEGGRVNPEKLTSFELYRNSIQDIEVITFDELYERACFIVRDN
ncbi:DUF4263 domain-containing protein [Amycolatopsis balhimycina DSM 5908]|uniref:DUF4263 domain-containing protein n=1 Tax=Amycolatopsis balhimycina DSM 5908 TaxID=1081091 RepID=A0A428WZZ1_AMYBA|nr:Shedu immune nuclease family protein [Amycolatopsis balhimycina]RSM48664.1 DUF4263 domain-containing protein [Amycolatopsis balhimycina DSM 5908]